MGVNGNATSDKRLGQIIPLATTGNPISDDNAMILRPRYPMNVCPWYQGVDGNTISNKRLDQSNTRATTGFHEHMMSNDSVLVKECMATRYPTKDLIKTIPEQQLVFTST